MSALPLRATFLRPLLWLRLHRARYASALNLLSHFFIGSLGVPGGDSGMVK